MDGCKPEAKAGRQKFSAPSLLFLLPGTAYHAAHGVGDLPSGGRLRQILEDYSHELG